MSLSRIKIVSRMAIGFGILMTIVAVVAVSSIILCRRTEASVVDLQRKTQATIGPILFYPISDQISYKEFFDF